MDDFRCTAARLVREQLLDELLEGVELTDAWRSRVIKTLLASRDEPLTWLLAQARLKDSTIEAVKKAAQGGNLCPQCKTHGLPREGGGCRVCGFPY